MVADVQERLADAEYDIADTIHLNGASSSATFVARFTILHPERVAAISAGITGVYTLPKEFVDSEVPAINENVDGKRLPYPVGVANLESLTGEEFNKEAWKDVDKYCYIGSEDRPDPEEDSTKYRSFGNLPEDLQELILDVYGTERINERFPVTKSVYEAVDPSAEFTIYDGYGHTTQPAQTDVIEFHLRSVGMQRRNLTGIPLLDQFGITVRQTIVGGVSFIGGTGYLLHRLENETDDNDP